MFGSQQYSYTYWQRPRFRGNDITSAAYTRPLIRNYRWHRRNGWYKLVIANQTLVIRDEASFDHLERCKHQNNSMFDAIWIKHLKLAQSLR